MAQHLPKIIIKYPIEPERPAEVSTLEELPRHLEFASDKVAVVDTTLAIWSYDELKDWIYKEENRHKEYVEVLVFPYPVAGG